jgi:hypothetical protein
VKGLIQLELGVLFAKSHHKVFPWFVGFKKDVHAPVRYDPVHKRTGEWPGSFQFPVTVNNLLQPDVGQEFAVGYLVTLLLDGWLDGRV